jgi:hypothetical protein
MIKSKKIEVKFVIFPTHPPGNDSIYVSNKAHKSDFLRMDFLKTMGGIYLDTDVFPLRNLDPLRNFSFTLGFDNIINSDEKAFKKVNNGVLLSTPNSTFLNLWIEKYVTFDIKLWDHHSSVVPFLLAASYPDLLHVEMHRISPLSYGFQTATAAAALTCGILVPKESKGTYDLLEDFSGIWYPRWSKELKAYTYVDTKLDTYMFEALSKKMALHLTMSAVRGLCMIRKNLKSSEDVKLMPSLLGSLFRTALIGNDSFKYTAITTDEERIDVWNKCRALFAMQSNPEDRGPYVSPHARQQYVSLR